MNATQRLAELVQTIVDNGDAPNWWLDDARVALAAAKEERGKVLTVQEIDALCDAYDSYVKNRYPDQWPEMSAGFEAGVRAVADSGYLAPAKGSGLTVEGVMKMAVDMRAELIQRLAPATLRNQINDIIDALKDLAGNGIGNLRTDGLTKDDVFYFAEGMRRDAPPTDAETDRWLNILAQAWPVLTEHASHMDGAFDNAHKEIRAAVKRLREQRDHAVNAVLSLYENSSGNLRTDPWISVEDRLPEPEEAVLWCGVPIQEPYTVASMLDEDFGYDLHDGSVTHWMPLPAPPDK